MSDGKQASRGSTASLDLPEIPESQLTRMDPDSILADEADPDGLLGIESESEAGVQHDSDGLSSKRTSAASAIFSSEAERSAGAHDHDQPRTPDNEQSSLALPVSIATPKQATHPDVAADPKVQELEEQVKDLTNQVTGLNGKLVRSFERISDLEDDLSDSQERIKAMSAKIAELEKERQEHLAALNTGLLVEKAHVSSEMQRMMDRVIEETAQRGKAESDKQRIEAELDELSSSLFNEANKMVAVERLARARAEEKSRQMEERLKDTEGIMLDQQRVLADLQRQVERQQGGRKADDDAASILSKDDDATSTHLLKASALARSQSQRAMEHQAHLMLSSLLGPEARVLINTVPYQEFRAFVAHLRKLRKQLSPFYNYPVPGINGGDAASSPAHGSPRTPSPAPNQNCTTPSSASAYSAAAVAYGQGYGGGAAMTTSPFVAAGVSRHRDYPHLPSNVESMVHLPSQLSLPFLKRSQEEDVDPCLRLDFAPGLNWLTRRQANTAILEGNLVIEPIFLGGKPPDEDALRREHMHLPPAACALCGIPVVNVPLPGPNSSHPAAADQSGRNTIVSSSIATATTSWASSAANSLREVTGASISSGSRDPSGTLSTKSSRPSLFSSFRRSAGPSKPPSSGDPESPSSQTAPLPSSDEPANSVLEPSPMETMLPVPTHIFRIQEGASSRYLLCPHHCLSRLRAVCQFWGFIRTMERSIVLEGKFSSGEAAEPERPLTTLRASSVGDVAPQVQTKEDVAPRADAPTNDSTTAVPQVVGSDVHAHEARANADASKEADAASTSQGDDGAEADRPESTSHDSAGTANDETAAQKQDPLKYAAADAATNDRGDQTDDHSDEEEGFADAVSSPKTKAQDSQEGPMPVAEDTNQDEEDDESNTPLARSTAGLAEEADEAGETKAPKSGSTATSSDRVEKADLPTSPRDNAVAESEITKDPATSEIPGVPPPLPRRSSARGANSPVPIGQGSVPALPPRRVARPQAEAAEPGTPLTPSTPSARPAPPIKVTLHLGGNDAVDWEDKMWTEITRLKQEMYKARIGLVVDHE
ncbi:hypothetical protein ACQY0O_005957 [Thecaphora frezii]